MIPEAALFAFGALTLMVAVVVSFDPQSLWDVAERLPKRPCRQPVVRPEGVSHDALFHGIG